MDMRGLAHFIQDIRKTTSNRDEEQRRIDTELGKIRSKFKESASLSTYDRKKYVCKLMFISMLGYPVEFGHMEGVQLLAMQSPAEKIIGYLSLTVFLHEGHELMTLTTHVVSQDLSTGKDLNASLALTAIANVGGKDYCETMEEGVRNLIKTTTNMQLRKKALLTYLRIWRRYRDITLLTEIVPLAIEWINQPLFGVAMAALTFLEGVMGEKKTDPGLFAAVPAAVTKLLEKIILDKVTEGPYIYYGVPAPWIQSKILRLLQHFDFPAESEGYRSQLLVIIGKIISSTSNVVRQAQSQQKQRGTANRCNAMICTMIEVVSLVIQWNLDAKLLGECTDLVNLFLSDKKDANTRYIGLMLMTRLSHVMHASFDFSTHCRQYQQQIAVALHDPDVSLRKKALHLTYNMCTEKNSHEIVAELLHYLPASEGSFKRDLVLMTVALAEKHSIDLMWYVETTISVISLAGDHVPADIWHRLCQVVVNHANVQKRAVEIIFGLLKQSGRATADNALNHLSHQRCPEEMVKVAAVLLGEFGYQIALNANSAPMDQVLAFQSKLPLVSHETKAMILTTMLKYFNLYDSPVVREKIIKIITSFSSSMDVELQQRAVEYLAMIRTNDATLQAVLEQLPPFEISANRVFELLRERSASESCASFDVVSADLWRQKELQRDAQEAKKSVIGSMGEKTEPAAVGTAEKPPADNIPSSTTFVDPTIGVTGPPFRNGRLLSTSGRVDSQVAVISLPNTPSNSTCAEMPNVLDAIFSGMTSVSTAVAASSSSRPSDEQIKQWFSALVSVSTGVLYSDDLVEICSSHEYRNADARLSLTIKAKSQGLSNVAVKLASTSASLLVQMKDCPSQIAVSSFVTVEFAARSLAPFKDSPSIRIQYSRGAPETDDRTVVLSLPIVSWRFTAPYRVDEVAKASTLWANTPTGDPSLAERIIASSSILSSKDNLLAVAEKIMVQDLRLYVCTIGGDELLGVGAHSTQPGPSTQFSPVLLRIKVRSSGDAIEVRSKNPSSLLQAVIVEVFCDRLQSK